MLLSICISCGNRKSAPYAKCRKCGFDPSRDETALAKSVYLSVGRYEDEADQERYRQELIKVGEAIHHGEQISYDAAELTRLLNQENAVKSVRLSRILLYLLRIFLPGIAFLAALILLYYLLKVFVFSH